MVTGRKDAWRDSAVSTSEDENIKAMEEGTAYLFQERTAKQVTYEVLKRYDRVDKIMKGKRSLADARAKAQPHLDATYDATVEL